VRTEVIEQLRKRKGLTQEEFAQSIDFTTNGYQKLIRSGDPKASVLEKISAVYGVNISFFFGHTNDGAMLNEPQAEYGGRDECADVREMNSILKSQLDHYKTMVDALHTVIGAFEAMQRHTVEKNTAHAKPTHKK
jgi:transcriptional regulator with XRE-family HTH domain